MSKNCLEIGTSPALAEGWFRARLRCETAGESLVCDHGAEREMNVL